MKIDIVIPTKNRLNKLLNCIRSIPKDKDVQIYIYFSDEKELNYFIELKESKDCKLLIVERYDVPTFWNTHLRLYSPDIMICLNDDVLMLEDTILEVKKVFNSFFPDLDGIVSLKQDNLPQEFAMKGAFPAIGIRYAERFPNKNVWCLDYNYFYGDEELMLYAEKIGKFYFAKNAKIIHLHPGFTGEQPDETHLNIRKYLKTDRNTFKIRRELNYLWGKNFYLIHENT